MILNVSLYYDYRQGDIVQEESTAKNDNKLDDDDNDEYDNDDKNNKNNIFNRIIKTFLN